MRRVSKGYVLRRFRCLLQSAPPTAPDRSTHKCRQQNTDAHKHTEFNIIDAEGGWDRKGVPLPRPSELAMTACMFRGQIASVRNHSAINIAVYQVIAKAAISGVTRHQQTRTAPSPNSTVIAHHRIILYRTAPHRTVLYCAVPYRTVPYRTVPYCTVPYRTVLYRTAPIALHRSAPKHTAVHRAVPHGTARYRTALSHRIPQHTELFCVAAPHCTALHRTALSHRTIAPTAP